MGWGRYGDIRLERQSQAKCIGKRSQDWEMRLSRPIAGKACKGTRPGQFCAEGDGGHIVEQDSDRLGVNKEKGFGRNREGAYLLDNRFGKGLPHGERDSVSGRVNGW